MIRIAAAAAGLLAGLALGCAATSSAVPGAEAAPAPAAEARAGQDPIERIDAFIAEHPVDKSEAGWRTRVPRPPFVRFDPSRPDGMPRKALDGTALAALGWTPRTSLRDGLAATVAAYRAQAERGAAAVG